MWSTVWGVQLYEYAGEHPYLPRSVYEVAMNDPNAEYLADELEVGKCAL